jgi:para-aminobenzoate synthetase component 1
MTVRPEQLNGRSPDAATTQLDRCGLRPPAHPHLPFLGGALGLFGYDLGRRFESLPAHAVADIVLPDMAVGIYDWALIVDHQRREVSLLSYGDPPACIGWRRSLPRQRPRLR